MPNPDPDTRLDRDVVLTRNYIGAAIIIGALIVLAYAVPWREGTAHAPLIALIWALACLVLGGFIGFLFGIPRVVQSEPGVVATGTTPETPAAATAGAAARKSANPYRVNVNTNIEQISDWLTKIIVGLGLIELRHLPAFIRSKGDYLATALALPGDNAFAVGLIVYFTIVGFLGGYLMTRMFIAGAFSRADRSLEPMPLEFEGKLTASEYTEVASTTLGPEESDRKIAARTIRAAMKISGMKLEDVKTPEALVAWSKAQLGLRHFREAARGYERALAADPDNVELLQEQAVALFYAADDPAEGRGRALAPLRHARDLIRDNRAIDPTLRKNIYKGLTFHSLYLPAPEGFTDAITYGEEYTSDTSNQQSVGIWMNLAAAYGQKAKYASEHPGFDDDSATTRAKALRAIRKSIELDPTSAVTLRTLLLKDAPKKAGEDDLEIFENDPEFRRILGAMDNEQ